MDTSTPESNAAIQAQLDLIQQAFDNIKAIQGTTVIPVAPVVNKCSICDRTCGSSTVDKDNPDAPVDSYVCPIPHCMMQSK